MISRYIMRTIFCNFRTHVRYIKVNIKSFSFKINQNSVEYVHDYGEILRKFRIPIYLFKLF